MIGLLSRLNILIKVWLTQQILDKHDLIRGSAVWFGKNWFSESQNYRLLENQRPIKITQSTPLILWLRKLMTREAK